MQGERRRGRGSVSNASGRFEPTAKVPFDDGWMSLEELPPFKTHVQVEKPRKIISRNESPDIGFDRSINPYRGCEHGCIYCYARPTHAYQGLSPGLDFESRLFVKPDAHELLLRELADPKYEPQMIALGTNTDPYQPIERKWQVTRRILEVLRDTGHPVGIVTKSAAGAARPRHPERDGREESGESGALGDDRRPRAGAGDGAARGDAAEAARDDPPALAGRRSDRRHGGADRASASTTPRSSASSTRRRPPAPARPAT